MSATPPASGAARERIQTECREAPAWRGPFRGIDFRTHGWQKPKEREVPLRVVSDGGAAAHGTRIGNSRSLGMPSCKSGRCQNAGGCRVPARDGFGGPMAPGCENRIVCGDREARGRENPIVFHRRDWFQTFPSLLSLWRNSFSGMWSLLPVAGESRGKRFTFPMPEPPAQLAESPPGVRQAARWNARSVARFRHPMPARNGNVRGAPVPPAAMPNRSRPPTPPGECDGARPGQDFRHARRPGAAAHPAGTGGWTAARGKAARLHRVAADFGDAEAPRRAARCGAHPLAARPAGRPPPAVHPRPRHSRDADGARAGNGLRLLPGADSPARRCATINHRGSPRTHGGSRRRPSNITMLCAPLCLPPWDSVVLPCGTKQDVAARIARLPPPHIAIFFNA